MIKKPSADFKAWLRGFAEALGDEPPTLEQWKRVLKKLEEIPDDTGPVYREIAEAALPHARRFLERATEHNPNDPR